MWWAHHNTCATPKILSSSFYTWQHFHRVPKVPEEPTACFNPLCPANFSSLRVFVSASPPLFIWRVEAPHPLPLTCMSCTERDSDPTHSLIDPLTMIVFHLLWTIFDKAQLRQTWKQISTVSHFCVTCNHGHHNDSIQLWQTITSHALQWSHQWFVICNYNNKCVASAYQDVFKHMHMEVQYENRSHPVH